MILCITKENLDRINGIFHFWYNDLPVDKETIVAFIRGADLFAKWDLNRIAKSGHAYSISYLIQSYIWNKYRIKHRNLQMAISQLALVKGEDWIKVFVQIFDDFQKDINWDLGFARIERISELGEKTVNLTKVDFELESIEINEITINIGSTIQLGDLMKEDYRKTILFDIDLVNPEWDLLIPSKRSFKYVRFASENASFENVIAAYSLMTSEVSRIYSTEGKTFIKTEHFEIEFEEALRHNEIIVGSNVLVNNNQSWQEDNMIELHDRAEGYRYGMITDYEFWRNIIGFDINAPFAGRKKIKRHPDFDPRGSSIIARSNRDKE